MSVTNDKMFYVIIINNNVFVLKIITYKQHFLGNSFIT